MSPTTLQTAAAIASAALKGILLLGDFLRFIRSRPTTCDALDTLLRYGASAIRRPCDTAPLRYGELEASAAVAPCRNLTR